MADEGEHMSLPKIRFDGTINWGHVIIVVGCLVSTGAAYTAVTRAIDNHELRLVTIEEGRRDAPRFREMLITGAARLDAVEKMQAQNAAINARILDALTGIREDIATLKADVRNK